jgi:hypothetical protein
VLGLCDIFFRNRNNWAIPGLKVNGRRRFINGEETFLNLLDLGPDLTHIIEQSSFNDAADMPLTDLKSQIQNTAERLTLFIGGNDVREICGNVYNGGTLGTFIEDFISDSAAILMDALMRLQRLFANPGFARPVADPILHMSQPGWLIWDTDPLSIIKVEVPDVADVSVRGGNLRAVNFIDVLEHDLVPSE